MKYWELIKPGTVQSLELFVEGPVQSLDTGLLMCSELKHYGINSPLQQSPTDGMWKLVNQYASPLVIQMQSPEVFRLIPQASPGARSKWMLVQPCVPGWLPAVFCVITLSPSLCSLGSSPDYLPDTQTPHSVCYWEKTMWNISPLQAKQHQLLRPDSQQFSLVSVSKVGAMGTSRMELLSPLTRPLGLTSVVTSSSHCWDTKDQICKHIQEQIFLFGKVICPS